MPTYDNPPPPHRRSWPEGGDRNHTWVPGDPTAGQGKLAGYWPMGDKAIMCVRYYAQNCIYSDLSLNITNYLLFSPKFIDWVIFIRSGHKIED